MKENSELVTTEKKTVDDKTVSYVTVRGTTNTTTNDVVFTNTREITVESGVNLDFLPYVLVLVGALAVGGAWFVVHKRRTVR
jgi:hypothetical protein